MDRKVVAVMTLDPQGAASRWDCMPEDGSYDLDPGGARGPPLDGTPCWKMGLMTSTLGVLRGPPLDGTPCWKMGLMASTLGVLRGLTLQVLGE